MNVKIDKGMTKEIMIDGVPYCSVQMRLSPVCIVSTSGVTFLQIWEN